MAGFDPDKARSVLRIPDKSETQCVFAIFYQGDKEALPESLKKCEKPSDQVKMITQNIPFHCWEGILLFQPNI